MRKQGVVRWEGLMEGGMTKRGQDNVGKNLEEGG